MLERLGLSTSAARAVRRRRHAASSHTTRFSAAALRETLSEALRRRAAAGRASSAVDHRGPDLVCGSVRLVLADAEGLTDDAIDERLGAWCAQSTPSRYLELLRGRDYEQPGSAAPGRRGSARAGPRSSRPPPRPADREPGADRPRARVGAARARARFFPTRPGRVQLRRESRGELIALAREPAQAIGQLDQNGRGRRHRRRRREQRPRGRHPRRLRVEPGTT